MKAVHRHGAALLRAVDAGSELSRFGPTSSTRSATKSRRPSSASSASARVLDALGRPQDRCRFVHVAGTNGKGSTCAMIESGLRARGRAHRTVHVAAPRRAHRAHPHRWRAGLRRGIRRRVRPRARARRGTARRRRASTCTPPTSRPSPPWRCCVFARSACDVVVLEVGLGGRLDATNVVDPELCRDHADRFRSRAFLGTQPRSRSPAEKAGILKPGVPAVFARQRPEAGRGARRARRGARASRWRAPRLGPSTISSWTRAAAASAYRRA